MDMRVTVLVENHSDGVCTARHGLSLYIETKLHRLLFDLGPDETVFENAEQLGIDLAAVDTVIISHGHSDHGGALGAFLACNHIARVYLQKSAFRPHYSTSGGLHSIGLDPSLEGHPQLVLLDGGARLDEELTLFTVGKEYQRYCSEANSNLLSEDGPDRFEDEQNLMIDSRVLVMGCGHRGVVNILDAAPCTPQVCIGGYHLMKPQTGETVPQPLLEGIASELRRRPVRYYTCHCTGQRATRILAGLVPDLHSLSCGEIIELP